MKRLCWVALGLGVAATACADEGMWQPAQLPAIAKQLSARGFKHDPAGLSQLTGDPMGAVVQIPGCTASFVSADGLVVTNHHCAYGGLQYNSTPEHNLIKLGLITRSLAEELPADPNARVYVTEEISDVTAKVTAKLTARMGDLERFEAIDAAEKALVAACEKPGYRCDVYVFHGGLSYQLVRQLEIKDVRLVYAPPDSIGKFGGEVDNWMWPRHTGDFAFLRAYVAPDGSSATFDKANVPYRPKHWLKVNAKGVAPGDYAMVVGYPGRTYRYRLSEEIENALAWQYPATIRINSDSIKLIDAAAAQDPSVGVKYASIVASLSNARKKYVGILEGFSRADPMPTKRAQEVALEAWVREHGSAQASLGADIAALHQLLAEQRAVRERDLMLTLLQRTGGFSATYTVYRTALERQKPDAQREYGYQQRDEIKLEGTLKQLERRFDPAVDRQLLAYFLSRYVALPAPQRMPALDAWLGNDTGAAAIEAKLAALYGGSKIADTAERLRWFKASRAELDASGDTWLVLMHKLMPDLLRFERESKQRQGRELELRPRYMTAMIAFNSARGQPIYPDANSSLRVTFGTVKGYAPRDGVTYAPFTSATGVLEKTTGHEPFNTPPAALAALQGRDFGAYASAELGTLPVDFLTDLDITGGNSGSPTLDADARLVGLAFDGNWESVVSDWMFDPARTRTIHVDIRYMLWVMDKVDHADRLVKELGIAAPL